jgi:CheY-specific phosphatase CheX
MTIPDAERERMIEAVTRVAERSLYAFAETVPVDLMPRTIDGGWHVASLQFTGPFSGSMSMAVPVMLGRQICSAFLGDDDVDDETAIRDLVGEFANMTCGTWLTAHQASACFNLTHPSVDAAVEVPVGDLAFVVNDMPVMLSLEIGAGA